MMLLGIDIGSVIAKAVLLDDSFGVCGKWWVHSRGDPVGALKDLIEKAIAGREGLVLKIGMTGNGRESFERPGEIASVNAIVSLAMGAAFEHPHANSVIEMGVTPRVGSVSKKRNKNSLRRGIYA